MMCISPAKVPRQNLVLFRIGDPANQTAAYIAGITGASTNSGAPVFIDSTGKLGTGGGSVSFTQVTGTLTSPQFTGTYSNSVTLSNANNVIDGNFTGNGSGLTGVSSGLSWPIVLKSADYAIQASDFSDPNQLWKLPHPYRISGAYIYPAESSAAQRAVRSDR